MFDNLYERMRMIVDGYINGVDLLPSCFFYILYLYFLNYIVFVFLEL